jgi:hypothetical protein
LPRSSELIKKNNKPSKKRNKGNKINVNTTRKNKRKENIEFNIEDDEP